MRTLYLHVGTHKTGTTSFQQFIVDRQAYLVRHGVQPHIELHGSTPSGNCFEFANYLIRNRLVTGARLHSGVRPQGPLEFLRYALAFRRKLRTSACRGYLVSSEGLTFLRTRPERVRLRLMTAGLGIRVVPIIVFRNDHDWRAAWLDQLSKTPQTSAMLGRPEFTIADDWYFDKDAIVRFWSSIGTPVIIDYDASRKSYGDIILPLMKAIGVPYVHDASYRLNSRATSA